VSNLKNTSSVQSAWGNLNSERTGTRRRRKRRRSAGRGTRGKLSNHKDPRESAGGGCLAWWL